MIFQFKLGDSLACLGYCALALERDPVSPKAVLYKSKVYNEMPFLQEIYKVGNPISFSLLRIVGFRLFFCFFCENYYYKL